MSFLVKGAHRCQSACPITWHRRDAETGMIVTSHGSRSPVASPFITLSLLMCAIYAHTFPPPPFVLVIKNLIQITHSTTMSSPGVKHDWHCLATMKIAQQAPQGAGEPHPWGMWERKSFSWNEDTNKLNWSPNITFLVASHSRELFYLYPAYPLSQVPTCT